MSFLKILQYFLRRPNLILFGNELEVSLAFNNITFPIGIIASIVLFCLDYSPILWVGIPVVLLIAGFNFWRHRSRVVYDLIKEKNPNLHQQIRDFAVSGTGIRPGESVTAGNMMRGTMAQHLLRPSGLQDHWLYLGNPSKKTNNPEEK